jgi:uncharacterized membrane protein
VPTSFQVTVEVDAPAEQLWQAVADVERWPAWTASMRQVSWIAGGELAVGSRARISQPGMPRLVWEVSELDAHKSFTWRTANPGVATTATHLIRPLDGRRAALTLEVGHSGPLARVMAALTSRRTNRFLRLEAVGLKRWAESAGS